MIIPEDNRDSLAGTAPSPPEMEQGYYQSTGGVRIFGCLHPHPAAQAVILMTHGLGEHSGRYQHVVNAFLEKDLAVVRFDWRGHGRSDGRRGHAAGYRYMLDDLSLMYRLTRERFPDLPVMLFGHSLGGNLAINWLLRRPAEATGITGAVLSSPWFTLTKQPSAMKVGVIRSLSVLWPSLLIPAGFRPRKLTRNPIAIAAYEHDPLIHRNASVRLISDAYFAGLWALDHAAECRLPILATHGTADSVTSPSGTELFCQRTPHAELILFDDLVHEPHNEPEWPIVVEEVRSWMLRQLSTSVSTPPANKPAIIDPLR